MTEPGLAAATVDAGPMAPAPAAVRAPVSVARAGESDRGAWEAFVAARESVPGASYHAWGWREVFLRAFGHRPHYLIARDAAGGVCGVLPLVEVRSLLFGRSLASLPFVNYGGVLAGSIGAADALVAGAGALARERGVRHVELRHVRRQFLALPCRQHKVAMRLALGPGMWDGFDRKVRNQVRKAEKSGLVASWGGAELVDEFYAVFARNMRDLGTPVYARALFDEVLRVFHNRARVIVVRLERRTVAAAITYRTGPLVEVPWASSIREYNSLCPNHLLYWHAIETAAAEGCETFDFGRSTPGEGTFKFKEQWGAQPVPLHWEYCLLRGGAVPDQGPTNPKFRMAIEAWKRFPLWFANAVGPRIVRGIP